MSGFPEPRLVAPVETHAQRASRLMAEARSEAAAHFADFVQRAAALHEMAIDIEAGGEVYAVGVREEARQLGVALARIARVRS
jgi:hypothetical protein